MADSIKELIMRDVMAALATISQANGYGNDIGKIERWQAVGMDQHASTILEVKQGGDVPREGFLGIDARTLSVKIFVKVRHDPDVDGLATDVVTNALEADIHKALMADRPRGGLADRTVFALSDENELEEGAGRVIKALEYLVEYRHSLTDVTQ